MPKPLQPNFVLDIETSELFIQAGLQDRVIQVTEWKFEVYTCIIYMYLHVHVYTCIYSSLYALGVWRISVHGFQQRLNGKPAAWYFNSVNPYLALNSSEFWMHKWSTKLADRYILVIKSVLLPSEWPCMCRQWIAIIIWTGDCKIVGSKFNYPTFFPPT